MTQSMLNNAICCGERFRITVIEGLRSAFDFNHRIEYGQMWHVCEEAWAISGNPIVNNLVAEPPWLKALKKYATELAVKHKNFPYEINNLYNICKIQFPEYVRYWSKDPETKKLKNIAAEEVFSVPYLLPSGRTVRVRGKFDRYDYLTSAKNAPIYLQENKAKGDIDGEQIKRQLRFDLQTMTYIIMLEEILQREVAGVRYNVIRRPLAGGKHSIRKHQPTKSNPNGESDQEFYERLQGLIRMEADLALQSKPPQDCWFFMRWRVEISREDIRRFKEEFLYPVLENLCDDYEWWDHCFRTGTDRYDYIARLAIFPSHRSRHFRMPFGIYDPLVERGQTDLDEYVVTGSKVGLTRVDRLFTELETNYV